MIYRINYSVDPKVIGNTGGQIHGFLEDIDGSKYHLYSDIPRFGEIEFELKLPPFRLEGAAKKTDLMDQVPFGDKFLLLSSKAKEIISNVVTDDVQWFPSEVWHFQCKMRYWALYFPNLRQEFIDWDRSTFSLLWTNKYDEKGGLLEIEEISLRDQPEYLDVLRSLRGLSQTVRVKTIQLAPSIEFDLFKMTSPYGGFFCSEKSKEMIENHNLSGFRFKKVS